MNITLIAVALASALVAYANGANDVSKGIATLAGSGVSNYRRAISWGTLWTVCGSIAAFAFSRALVVTFGSSLFATAITFHAAIATLVGAGLWVALATRFGFPVSTTHAIVGSIAGVAAIAYGPAGMNWSVLAGKVALPLLLSPVASLLLSVAILRTWNHLCPAGADCLCAEIVDQRPLLATTSGDITASLPVPSIQLVACRGNETAVTSARRFSLSFDRMHWLTSATASFARGLNDAPKMVAISLAAASLSGFAFSSSLWVYLLIAFGIGTGSLQAGRRVTAILAESITPMDHREGFVANLVTSLLVGPAAITGLPMSITQVSSGAIIGIGLQKGGPTNWHGVTEIALAWLVTLPAAALLGILAYGLLHVLGVR